MTDRQFSDKLKEQQQEGTQKKKKMMKIFSQRRQTTEIVDHFGANDTRIDDQPAMPHEPNDHDAVAEYRTVVLETTGTAEAVDESPRQKEKQNTW